VWLAAGAAPRFLARAFARNLRKHWRIFVMSNKVVNTLSVAVGAALLGTVMAANASNPFSLNDLGQGYQIGEKAGEGKCGTGSCGKSKGMKCMDMKEKADQDKCMTDAKSAEAHCGAAVKHKDGEKACGAKGGEKSCSGDKKGGEKSCAGDKKGGEKSCSGDKKGAEKACSHG
jgi:uncharacterized low-complexity protein